MLDQSHRRSANIKARNTRDAKRERENGGEDITRADQILW